MRPALVRLVLALYPAPVRSRYGAEIAELLARSTRPWRDLADVGRAALTERMAAWSWRDTLSQLGRLAWIATVPIGLTLGVVVVSLAPFTLLNILDNDAGIHVSDTALNVVGAVSAVPIYAEAIWFANRRARCDSPVAPALTVPIALALGMLAFTASFGAASAYTLLAVAFWGAAMFVISIASGTLARRGRPDIAVLVLVSALALEASCTLSAIEWTGNWLSALTAWPSAISGLTAEPILAPAPPFGLPFMLTACTAYALPLIRTRRSSGWASLPQRP
jgi:hypothetical protein